MAKLDEMLLDAFRRRDAAKMGNLLNQGASPDLRIDGAPLLHIAAVSGESEIVDALLDAGADVNARDDHSRTALMYLAWIGHTDAHREIVDRLVNHGADLDAMNINGDRVLDGAVRFGNRHMATQLKKLGATCSVASNHMLERMLQKKTRHPE